MTNEEKLIDALNQHKDPVYGPVKVTGNGWIRIRCPTCNEYNRKKYKRYIKVDRSSSICFICNIRKDVQDLLEGHYMPHYNANAPRVLVVKKIDPRATELPYYKCIPVNELGHDHPAYKFLAKDYLFDMEDYYTNHGIVYIPTDGGKVFKSTPPYTTSAERLIFPVMEGGQMVGWQMRSIPGTFYGDRKDVIRYFHLFDKGNHLYNFERAKENNPKEVVVVEGVKKALKFPNGVATWGSSISTVQSSIIQQWPRIVMMLDAKDHSGTIQSRAQAFVEGWKFAGRKAINIDLANYGVESPDDLPAETLKTIIEEAWHEQE